MPFTRLPLAIGGRGGWRAGSGKDMRMAPHHLIAGRGEELLEASCASLFKFQRHEQHGVEHVAELFTQRPGGTAVFDRFKHFPGFFDEVGEEAGDGLGAVPGAASGGLEAAGGGDQIPKWIAGAELGVACLTLPAGYVMMAPVAVTGHAEYSNTRIEGNPE